MTGAWWCRRRMQQQQRSVIISQQTIAAQQPTAHCAKFADTRGMERTACFFVFLHPLAVAEMQRLCSCKTHFAYYDSLMVVRVTVQPVASSEFVS